jgi:hypothetical protein
MSRNARRQNIRKLEQAITHINRAKDHIDQVAVQYQAGYVGHAFDFAVISQSLELCNEILTAYGMESLPLISTTLDTISHMIEAKKRIE